MINIERDDRAATWMTQGEFDQLPEYNHSLPTSPQIGFKWKRDMNATRRAKPNDWNMCEVTKHKDRDKVGLRWTIIQITDPATLAELEIYQKLGLPEVTPPQEDKVKIHTTRGTDDRGNGTDFRMTSIRMEYKVFPSSIWQEVTPNVLASYTPSQLRAVADLIDKANGIESKPVVPERVLSFKARTTLDTSFLERFGDALEVLCDARPPLDILVMWCTNTQIDGVDPLQEWALEHTVLDWAQGIAVVEAAIQLADNPIEGEDFGIHTGSYADFKEDQHEDSEE